MKHTSTAAGTRKCTGSALTVMIHSPRCTVCSFRAKIFSATEERNRDTIIQCGNCKFPWYPLKRTLHTFFLLEGDKCRASLHGVDDARLYVEAQRVSCIGRLSVKHNLLLRHCGGHLKSGFRSLVFFFFPIHLNHYGHLLFKWWPSQTSVCCFKLWWVSCILCSSCWIFRISVFSLFSSFFSSNSLSYTERNG